MFRFWGWVSGGSAEGLVVAGGVEGEVAEEFTVEGVDADSRSAM